MRNDTPESQARRNGGGVWCNFCGRDHAPFLCPDELRRRARAVVAYWDELDTIPPDDARPTEHFKATMDRLIDGLRTMLSPGTVTEIGGLPHDEKAV